MSQPDSNEVFEAYVHAVEKKERNGKWKIRGLEITSDSTPESSNFGEIRYRRITSAAGKTFDEACDNAWHNMQKDPALRVYLVHAIRSI
jgi:hypothetical protein